MNERLENYLLDQIERLTADLSREKDNSEFWVGIAKGKDEEIKRQGAVIEGFADRIAEKDEMINMQNQAILNLEAQIRELDN
jgi:ATP-dependent Clp protease ATP-binding subunit ClpA